MLKRFSLLTLIAAALAGDNAVRAQGLFAGPNVNMVNSGKKKAADMKWPQDNIFLQASNEPSMDPSTRNPLNILAGANDYRAVDFSGLDGIAESGDVWVADFKSFDGGLSWTSNLHPGCSFKINGALIPECRDGGVLEGKFAASSDPVVRTAHNGLFYYAFIAFNRGNNATGAIAVSRYIDNNNKPAADKDNFGADQRIPFLDTTIVDKGTAGTFLDKPAFFADVPRANAPSCSIGGAAGVPSQSFPAGNIYLAYAKFTGQDSSDPDNNPKSQVLLAKSSDCGKTWKITQVAQSFALNNGLSIAVDPNNGNNVYVAWRLLKAAKNDDAIMIAKSTNGGASFGNPVQVVSFPLPAPGTPPAIFDQPKVGAGVTGAVNGVNITGPSFRTKAFPVLAIDGNSRLYLAWSQRGMVAGTSDARIVLTTSTDSTNWSPLQQVAPIPGTSWNPGGRGHQLMPAMTVVGDRLAVAFLDQGEDHTKATYATSTSPEVRVPIGSLLDHPEFVYTPYIADGTPGLKLRHTLDVRVAYAIVSNGPPVFQPSVKVSRYRAGAKPGSSPGAPKPLEQIEFNPPNFTMFVHGTSSFIGDYIEIKGLSAIPSGNGWRPNLRLPGDPPTMVFNTALNVAWADDRNVRPPYDKNWANWTPVGSPATVSPGTTATTSGTIATPGSSLFCSAGTDCAAGTQRPACQPRQAMARNQNVYTARLDSGVYMAAVSNFKQPGTDVTGAPIKRAYTLVVQNTTPDCRSFVLSFANVPAGVSFLSFLQNSVPSPNQLTVNIPGKSTISRTVYVTSSVNPPPTVTVNAQEVFSMQCGTAPSGLQASAALNPDPTNPAVIDAVTGGSLGPESYTPDILSVNSVFSGNSNQNILNPVVTDGDIIDGDIIDGDIIDGDIIDGDIIDGDIIDGDIIDGDIIDGDIISGTMVDTNITTANIGNTPGSFQLKLYQKKTINVCPASCGKPGQPSCPIGCLKLQMIVRKTARKLQSGTCPKNNPFCATACQLQATGTSVTVANVPRPRFSKPGQLPTADGDIIDGDIINATTAFGPLDDSTKVTLRSVDPSGTTSPVRMAATVADAVTAQGPPASSVIGAQPANTGNSIPSLTFIVTKEVVDGVSGLAYNPNHQPLGVYGGISPVTTTIIGGTLSPCSLTLTAGVLSGTPPSPATCTITVKSQDSAVPPHVDTQDIAVRIGAPLAVTTASLPGIPPGGSYSATLAATGGFLAYTWSVIEGSLPPNFTLSSGGTITGTAPASPGIYNFKVQVVDTSCLVDVNNCQPQTASKSLTIAIDNTPPVIVPTVTPAPNAAGWHKTLPVSVSWSVTDPESGIASSTGCGPTIFTNETGGTTLTCSATNGAGLSNSVSVTIKIDTTPPTISLTRPPPPPANTNYLLNTVVTAAYTCADALSGLSAPCVGVATNTTAGTPPTAVPNGASLPSPVGAYTFAITATDVAGNSSVITANYAVTYNFIGFASPLLTAGPASAPTNSGSANQGQGLPVKWQLTDGNGVAITNLASLTSLMAVPSSACGPPGPSAVNICSTVGGVSSCAGSTTYRGDTSGNFIVNADTTAMAKACYEIVATFNDSKAYGTLVKLQ